MKIKIILTLILISVWGFLNRGIFYTTDVVAKNTLAVATVNGGNSELAAQNVYNAGTPVLAFWWTILFIAVLVIIWAGTVAKLFADDDTEDYLNSK